MHEHDQQVAPGRRRCRLRGGQGGASKVCTQVQPQGLHLRATFCHPCDAQVFKQDYRGTAQFLADFADLRAIIELGDSVPHDTTLQKANARMMGDDALFRRLLKQTLEQFYRSPQARADRWRRRGVHVSDRSGRG